jgi:hypothetical protein
MTVSPDYRDSGLRTRGGQARASAAQRRADVQLPLYAGQFVLGPAFVESLPGWQRFEIGNGLRLTAHPQLSVSRTGTDETSLTLVGFMLDPRAPAATDADILRSLLPSASSAEALAEATASLGGRWVLIAVDHPRGRRFLINDALGLRQVFFTTPDCAYGLRVMSQPGMGAELLGLEADAAADSYMHSDSFRTDPEYKWPGAATAFKEIRHLLPNHSLDLATGSWHRYWPNRALERVELAEAVERMTGLLRGQIAAAERRFDLVVGLTAGLDSRVVLAACRGLEDRIEFATIRQARMRDDSADIQVSTALAGDLGLRHRVIRAPVAASAEFSAACKRSVYLAHEHYEADAEAILRCFAGQKVAVTGSGAEVGRCHWRETFPARWLNRTPGAERLARLELNSGHEFAVGHLHDWLEGAGGGRHVNVLDLFEWEQGHGNWLAMTQLEFDSVWKDIFTPYNCRELLVTMLSVDERHRRPPHHRLFTDLIRRIWPEALDQPVNPHKRKTGLGDLALRPRFLWPLAAAVSGAALAAALLSD